MIYMKFEEGRVEVMNESPTFVRLAAQDLQAGLPEYLERCFLLQRGGSLCSRSEEGISPRVRA